MRILGIDYGRAKVGLALAEGRLAEPYEVIRYQDTKILSAEIEAIIEKEKIDKIIIGISEGKMGEESREFSSSLKTRLNVPVETFDETLTTQEAQKRAIEAGVRRQKRKQFEDAFAASIMLQSYLDR